VQVRGKYQEQRMTEIVELDRRDHFPSLIIRRDNQLELHMLVASGHAGRSCVFPLTDRHLEAAQAEPDRYLFAYAALHHPFQLAKTELPPDEVGIYLDRILLAPEGEVETFLTDLDHGRANGALSNLVHLCSEASYERMRSGRWFAANTEDPSVE
jgi:hypothetical protein